MYAVIEYRSGEWKCVAILSYENEANKWRDSLLSDGAVAAVCKINRRDILRAADRIKAE